MSERFDYSFPGNVGQWGLGGIAAQQVQTLKEHDALGEVYEGLTRTGTGHNDWEHDAVVALKRLDSTAPVHAWGNAAWHTFLSTFAFTKLPTLVLERASTHPEWQAKVLHAEARAFGLGYEPTNALDVQRGSLECAKATRIVTPSAVARATFPASQQGRVAVVPFGTHVDHFQGTPQPRDGGGVVFGFLGQNWFRKGLVRLLDAWNQAHLWEQGHALEVAGVAARIVLDIGGQLGMLGKDAPNPAPAHPRGESASFRGVRALGHVGDAAQWLQGLDAFVLPSLEEGHAQVLIEAGAAGLPVVCTRACGHPIQHGTHGLLLQEAPGTPPAPSGIGDALTRLAKDEGERRRLGVNHRALVRQEFTWDKYRERLWRGVYKLVLEDAAEVEAKGG